MSKNRQMTLSISSNRWWWCIHTGEDCPEPGRGVSLQTLAPYQAVAVFVTPTAFLFPVGSRP